MLKNDSMTAYITDRAPSLAPLPPLMSPRIFRALTTI